VRDNYASLPAQRRSPPLSGDRRVPQGALHKTRHQNMALRDRAPESDFRGYFSDTETKLDEGNTAISRHFERGPL